MESHAITQASNSSVTLNPDGLTAEQMSLLQPLIRKNAWPDFQTQFDEIHKFWSTMVLDTALLAVTTIPDVENALLMLDNIIENEATLYWQRRLAYQQLARVLASAEQILANRRRIERLPGNPGKNLSAVLLDTYVRAIGGRVSRNDVYLRMRWAKRQSVFFGGSMFLPFAYSDQAETKMYVSYAQIPNLPLTLAT
ncbi:hypothetical protein QQS21_007256 [Conoideocrella luteorostrata]|uniref:Uncharacterized protein n=1 Tax=Conoideocrella luteorostrata TaxID=1105319 RepID=A0AAJ0FSL0_9HYPO|nr:hypothetical protein QQS21_007256 [Conoideocrella luteorostrata]